jgi:hypothetical protein
MRLLELKPDDELVFTEYNTRNTPSYAILSHTWAEDNSEEVSFQDVEAGIGKGKPGWKKIDFCAKQAAADGLRFFWIDTCSINKDNFTELSYAINSMYRWYYNAERCYVYLSDVSVRTHDGESHHVEWESAFRNSRWFTRGWTLQELLAPRIVVFYSQDHVRLGDRTSLEQQITNITGIAVEALRGQILSDFGVEELFHWAEKRQTTKEEDKAYCLLGIFDVFLPLIYGEGQSKAMRRLRKEVLESASTRSQSRGNI